MVIYGDLWWFYGDLTLINGDFMVINGDSKLVGGIPTPLKNTKVNWDDYS